MQAFARWPALFVAQTAASALRLEGRLQWPDNPLRADALIKIRDAPAFLYVASYIRPSLC